MTSRAAEDLPRSSGARVALRSPRLRVPTARLGRRRAARTLELLWPLPDRDGPLVAVAGLCGGAGASTLAHLIAAAATDTLSGQDRATPVLACDAGNTAQGLALYAGVSSRRSLRDTARHLAGGGGGELFSVGDDGLRVIASVGSPDVDERDAGAVARLLGDARQAHGLTVVDCGTLVLPEQRVALQHASHVLWVVPASSAGLRRGHAAWQSAPAGSARETLVARSDPAGARPGRRDLSRMAQERGATLVLMPDVGEAAERSTSAALECCQVSLQAIAAEVCR